MPVPRFPFVNNPGHAGRLRGGDYSRGTCVWPSPDCRVAKNAHCRGTYDGSPSTSRLGVSDFPCTWSNPVSYETGRHRYGWPRVDFGPGLHGRLDA